MKKSFKNKRNNDEIKEISIEYIPDFLVELRQLISSGVTPSEAIDIIRDDEDNSDIRSKLDLIFGHLNDGKQLGDSIEKAGGFPSYMCKMITIAEDTGKLEDVLESLEIYYNRQISLRKSIKNAIITPLILLITMIVVIFILSTQVVPVFYTTFKQLGIDGNSILSVGKILSSISLALATVIAIIAITIGIALTIKKSREKILYIVYNRFGNTGILRQISVSKLTYSLSLSVSTGMNIDDALESASNSCIDNKNIINRISKCRELLNSGDSLLDAFSNSGLFNKRESKLLKISEQSGNISNALERMANNQEEQLISKIDSLINKVEPCIIFISCILAGSIMISLMLPLLSVISKL